MVSSLSPRLSRFAALALLSVSLTACGGLERLSRLGSPPDHAEIENPVAQRGYKPVTTPQPEMRVGDDLAQPNSLWRPGSRAFFRDQRAGRVGDILTIKINISDNANLKNETKLDRTAGDSMTMPNVLGMESSVVGKFLPGDFNPANALKTTTGSSHNGKGEIKRNESIITNVAATIIQKLPNGNLVVNGTQEVLVNNEMRELAVRGVIRPEDIASDNTITHDKIADARITYGGKGSMSDIQSARYGQQLIDIISPF